MQGEGKGVKCAYHLTVVTMKYMKSVLIVTNM